MTSSVFTVIVRASSFSLIFKISGVKIFLSVTGFFITGAMVIFWAVSVTGVEFGFIMIGFFLTGVLFVFVAFFFTTGGLFKIGEFVLGFAVIVFGFGLSRKKGST